MRGHAAAAARYSAALAGRMGIEASGLAALDLLQFEGPMTPGRLGGRLSMSPGAVTALVDRMEKRGHVRRLPNPEDRRSTLVRATEAGLQDPLRHLLPYIEEMRRIEETFTPQERAVIARFLEAVTGATHRHAEALSAEHRSGPK